MLDRDELAALLPILRAGTDAHAAARRFAALTGHADVSGLHWRQIDLSAGTLTYRTKPAGIVSVHTVALPGAAIDLLRGLPSGAPGDAVFPHAKAHSAVLRFILLTLARREEAAGARWREIDLTSGTWTVPGERTKNAEPHTVPLSRQAIALLRALGPGAADELVFRTFAGGPISNWDRETKILQEASGTEGWTRHDLRRTGATMLGEMGELPDIIEAALNHVTHPLAAGRDLQSEPLPSAGGSGAATVGGRAGWDRGGSGRGGAAARAEPDVPGREDTQLGINLLYCRFDGFSDRDRMLWPPPRRARHIGACCVGHRGG